MSVPTSIVNYVHTERARQIKITTNKSNEPETAGTWATDDLTSLHLVDKAQTAIVDNIAIGTRVTAAVVYEPPLLGRTSAVRQKH